MAPRRVVVLIGFVAAASACAPAPPPAAVPPPPTATCPGPPARAVELATEGDRLRAMDRAGAAARYDEAVALAPEDASLLVKAARAHEKLEDFDGAARLYARAARARPDFATTWFGLGAVLAHVARKQHTGLEDARIALEKSVQLDPNLADAHEQLGGVRLALDDERGALESYGAAIRLDPAPPWRWAALADLYLRLDRLTEAAAVLELARKHAHPDRPAGWVPIDVLGASVASARGDTPAMVAALERAHAEADPTSPEALTTTFSLGAAYATLSPPRKQEAIAVLKSFFVRACKGSKAASYKTECEVAMSLVQRLGGTLQ